MYILHEISYLKKVLFLISAGKVTPSANSSSQSCASPEPPLATEPSSSRSATVPATPTTATSPTKANLRKKLNNYRVKVHRLKHQLQKQKLKGPNPAKSTKQKIENIGKAIAEFVDGQKYDFIMSQIKNAKKKNCNKRWTYKDKAFALSLLHSSPKTYRLLRKVLDLPSPKTLKMIMRNVGVYPGFNKQILAALKKKLSNAPVSHRVVSLVIDEMAIKEGLSYDSGRDVVEGFVEAKEGGERSEVLANHAIAFMVRGLAEKWKQPIGYYLSSGPMSGKDMKDHIFEAIQLLKDIGLTVGIVICDQGSNNQNLFVRQLGVKPGKPYFFCQGAKVYTMYDPPHLIKSVRNNFKKHGFTLDENDIKWQHLSSFYDADSSKPIRLAPKLKKKHIELPPFSPLRVRLATQVLSHSVAAGMAVMTQWGILCPEAIHTADFIEKFDQLFNCFNSRRITSSAKMQHAMTSSSKHDSFLAETKEWLKKIKTKGKKAPPCLDGWQQAIDALLLLWQELHDEHDFKYLLTSRLNQDCIENLFCIIRAKGAQRDNPDASQFRQAFRQVMVDSVMVPSNQANCEEDVDQFICTLDQFKGKTSEQNPTPTPSVLDDLPFSVKSILSVCTMPSDLTHGLTFQEVNVLTYIGAYIVRKLSGRICSPCKDKIIGQVDEDNPNHDFVAMKSYGYLTAPSNVLLGIMELLEDKYRTIIDTTIHQQHVKAQLTRELGKINRVHDLNCDTCHLHLLTIQIFINIRLNHSIREINHGLRDNKDRKNRKTLKFAHL